MRGALTIADADLDGLPNDIDQDDDQDGLADTVEQDLRTDPLDNDTDNDGLTDGFEVNFNHDPPDTYTEGSDLDPLVPDTDGDGILDGDEITAGTDPLDAASAPVPGDVNIDGEVNTADVLLAQRALMGAITLSDEQAFRANVAPLSGGVPAPDDMFDLGDLLVIQHMALGI